MVIVTKIEKEFVARKDSLKNKKILSLIDSLINLLCKFSGAKELVFRPSQI